MKIIKQLNNLGRNWYYWLFYIVLGVSLLAAALYSQFVHEELPCIACIQVRLLISLLIIVAMAGLWLRNNTVLRAVFQLSVVLIIVALAERSYLLLGTERGFIFSDCGFNLGLPSWFAIEQWLPWLYQVETSCGYTPEVIFGITMAESLMALSVVLLILSLSVFVSNLLNLKKQ